MGRKVPRSRGKGHNMNDNYITGKPRPADGRLHISSLQKALLNPAIYPDLPKEVKFIETHISLLFLTGNHVYKVKKPVDFGFLDFTSLEKRKYFCEQEVKLNRRLSPDIYLGVVQITRDRDKISFDGRGEVEEYAVKMKQIPEELLMDKLLEKGRVNQGMMEALSERLVRFYFSAETNETIKSFGRPERVKQDTDENFEQTQKYVDLVIPKQFFEEIRSKTNEFFRAQEKLFHQRIASDRIRDCHGDLRLEHIFWGKEISIFDCIEFNQRFRYTDVAADIAFLAMDLDYHGREDLSEHLIQVYIEKSGDQELLYMLDFYKCYRAYVRGKVESFRLDDPNIPEKEKSEALKRAQKYFDLAWRYAQRLK
jgi:aminoglycoside phosphotransferase family enzyme